MQCDSQAVDVNMNKHISFRTPEERGNRVREFSEFR